MNRHKTRTLLGLAMVFGLVACQQSAPPGTPSAAQETSRAKPAAAATPVAAKVNLAKAREMGKAWQADAELFSIITATAGPDGLAVPGPTKGFDFSWHYWFYSKGKKEIYTVAAKTSGLQGEEHSLNSAPEPAVKPLGDAFVDSDKAMELAKSKGWKPEGYHIFMTLSAAHMPTTWFISDGSTTHHIDADKGRLID